MPLLTEGMETLYAETLAASPRPGMVDKSCERSRQAPDLPFLGFYVKESRTWSARSRL
jgi:hypothetical protein